MVKYLTSMGDFTGAMKQSEEKLVVIDFTATWCPPCRMIGPIFEKFAEELSDGFYAFKVDVDDASDIASECGISAMPTFQFFKGGEKVDEFSGANEAKLRATIEKHM